MTNTQTYLQQPYLFSLNELMATPIGDVIEIIKAINTITAQQAPEMKIHFENIKMIQEFFGQISGDKVKND
jgi:hypothetical protein